MGLPHWFNFLLRKKKKKNSLLEMCCYQPAKEGLFHDTVAAAFFCQSEFLTSLFMMDWTLKEGDYFGVLQSKSFQGYLVLNISFLDDSWVPRPQGSMRSKEAPTRLLSPLWTAEQHKRPLKGESPHCPQAAQMPKTSLIRRSWTQLGHPPAQSRSFTGCWWEVSLLWGIKNLGLGPWLSSESSSLGFW